MVAGNFAPGDRFSYRFVYAVLTPQQSVAMGNRGEHAVVFAFGEASAAPLACSTFNVAYSYFNYACYEERTALEKVGSMSQGRVLCAGFYVLLALSGQARRQARQRRVPHPQAPLSIVQLGWPRNWQRLLPAAPGATAP